MLRGGGVGKRRIAYVRGARIRAKHEKEIGTNKECLSLFGEANALVSELPSITSSSSLVGTVTGSFLKLKVITSLSS